MARKKVGSRANSPSKGPAGKPRSPEKRPPDPAAEMGKVFSKPPEPARELPIVGIGASAGGLEAFEQFFKNMPSDSGMAFVLVPHLDPGHSSMMPDLLRRITRMKVVEAGHGVKVEANQVYTIPPNKDMAIKGGTLQLTIPEKTRGLRLPIDFFLRSLAEDHGDKAIAIILSGTGTDGSIGLRAIHGAGGMIMVQEANSAKYEGMPRSALDTGLADFVLPAEKMPQQLLSYGKKISAKKGRRISTSDEAPSSLQKVMMALRSKTGHDFSAYKKSTIYRRLEKRMDVHNLEDLGQYVRLLQENPDEVQGLFKELLIGVTSFFRDPEAFEILKKNVLPGLLEDKPEEYIVRVWVPGCATGEEVYSLAILFREYMNEAKRHGRLQIFGTDIDEEAIRRARVGSYTDNIAIDVTPERLRRFFVNDESGLRIKKEVRESVIFAAQNVIKDAPFTKLDLISCRNLLIYLEPELQNRLIPLFHYSLRPQGVLFLGSSETIGKFSDFFGVVDKKWKIFTARPSATQQVGLLAGPVWPFEGVTPEWEKEQKKSHKKSLPEKTQQALLEAFVPPSVLVNEKGEIVFIHGQTGQFLEPSPGQPSVDILEMAREGIKYELRSALHNAITKKKESHYDSLRVKTNHDYQPVDLSVKPLSGSEMEGLYLVSFRTSAPPGKGKGRTPAKKALQKVTGRQVTALEQELTYTRESLQATIEELQAANEELRSTNEEFQSTNEELQSTNEELETSKEELQSVNEELVTVNSELQAKIDQLSRTESDMKALLDSTNIGTIFLDMDLSIKRFTFQATKVFNLIPSDVGRSIGHIRSNLEYDNLLSDSQRVLETLQPMELELKTNDSRWYLMRIAPSRTQENQIDGVVATFTDVTHLKQEEQHLTDSKQELFGVLESISDGVFSVDREWKFTYMNKAGERFWNQSRKELLGKSLWEVAGDARKSALSARFRKALKEKAPVQFEVAASDKDGVVEFRAFPSDGGLTVYFHETKDGEKSGR